MKKLSFLLLLLSTCVHAEIPQTCQLIDDSSETIMQLRQNGLSLSDIDLNAEALSDQELQLLKDMIEDAKRVPIYKIAMSRQKAVDDFKVKWQQQCLASVSKDKVHENR